MGHIFYAASIKHHMEYSCGLLVPGKNRQAKPKSLNLEIKRLRPEWPGSCDLQGFSLAIHSLQPDYGPWTWVHKGIMTVIPQWHERESYPTQWSIRWSTNTEHLLLCQILWNEQSHCGPSLHGGKPKRKKKYGCSPFVSPSVTALQSQKYLHSLQTGRGGQLLLRLNSYGSPKAPELTFQFPLKKHVETSRCSLLNILKQDINTQLKNTLS